MIYLSYGMQKSGSTFCFQITRDLIRQHCLATGMRLGCVQDVLPESPHHSYFAPSAACDLDDFLERALEISADNVWIPVKVHCGLSSRARKLIESGRILASASFRHPGDCLLSLMDAHRREAIKPGDKANRFPDGRDFNSALKAYIKAGKIFFEWADAKNVLLVYYNDIVSKPETVVEKLKEQIGLADGEFDPLGKYLQDKSRILEFNKGVLDRRLHELAPDQLRQVERKCAKLVDFIARHAG